MMTSRPELEDNANIIMDFGSLKGDKAWRTGVILTKTDIKAEATVPERKSEDEDTGIGDLTSLYWMILRMMRMSTRRSRGRS